LVSDLGYHLSDADLHEAVKKLDKSGDKKIQFDEFSAWWNSDDKFKKLHGHADKLEGWTKSFKDLDKNHSGVLDGDEIHHLHAELSKKGVTDKSLDAFKNEIDTNKNGKISFNEYVDWLLVHGKSH